MESKIFMRRIAALMLFGLILVTVITFTSCSDDDDGGDPEPTTLAGVYAMQKGVLTEDILDSLGNLALPVGTDITALMAAGIFGASPCTDAANSVVDMNANGKLYFECVGSDAGIDGIDAGSWSENSTLTILTLSLNSDVVPPIGFTLPINNIVQSGNTLEGDIDSVPLTKELLETFYPQYTFAAIVITSVEVTFSQVP